MSDLRQIRLDKLEKLKSLGFDAYPQPNLKSKNNCLEAQKMLGQNVVLAGRLMSLRGHGQILFGDLVDRTGKIQLFFQSDILKEKFDLTWSNTFW